MKRIKRIIKLHENNIYGINAFMYKGDIDFNYGPKFDEEGITIYFNEYTKEAGNQFHNGAWTFGVREGFEYTRFIRDYLINYIKVEIEDTKKTIFNFDEGTKIYKILNFIGFKPKETKFSYIEEHKGFYCIDKIKDLFEIED